MKSRGDFSDWLQGMWQRHQEEIDQEMGMMPEYDLKKYFGKYKYWLKREYLRQRNNERIRIERGS